MRCCNYICHAYVNERQWMLTEPEGRGCLVYHMCTWRYDVSWTNKSMFSLMNPIMSNCAKNFLRVHLPTQSNPCKDLIEAQRLPGGWGSQIARQSAHESGEIVDSTHRPPLPPPHQEILLVLISVRLRRLQGHGAAGRIMPMKNSSGTSRIAPATFQLSAQCLIQIHHRVPPVHMSYIQIRINDGITVGTKRFDYHVCG